MSARTQAFALMLFGAVLLVLGASDLLLRFVRPSSRPWILAGGAAVVLLAVWSLVASSRSRAASLATTDAHGHAAASRLTWLTLLPSVAVLLIAPPALGAFTANRQTQSAAVATGEAFGPLPSASPVELSVVEFAVRALDRDGRTLRDRTVSLTGFVTKQAPNGFLLARLVITCCAADAIPVLVRVESTDAPPPTNRWVTVIGRYIGQSPGRIPVLRSVSIRSVAAPTNPYES